MITEIRNGLLYVTLGAVGAIAGAILADKAGQDGRLGMVAGVAGGLFLAEIGVRRGIVTRFDARSTS